jgi:hypothetical protein
MVGIELTDGTDFTLGSNEMQYVAGGSAISGMATFLDDFMTYSSNYVSGIASDGTNIVLTYYKSFSKYLRSYAIADGSAVTTEIISFMYPFEIVNVGTDFYGMGASSLKLRNYGDSTSLTGATDSTNDLWLSPSSSAVNKSCSDGTYVYSIYAGTTTIYRIEAANAGATRQNVFANQAVYTPIDIAVDGTDAYVIDTNVSNNLEYYDISGYTGTAIATDSITKATIGANPTYVTVDTNYVYVLSDNGIEVFDRADITTGPIYTEMPTGYTAVKGICVDGAKLYVGAGDGTNWDIISYDIN